MSFVLQGHHDPSEVVGSYSAALEVAPLIPLPSITHIYISMNKWTYVHIYICIYTYIYIHRERPVEMEMESHIDIDIVLLRFLRYTFGVVLLKPPDPTQVPRLQVTSTESLLRAS